MLGSQAARLRAGLAAPAGARWRATVDRWLAGGDVYNFAAWNGALLAQLTGDSRYAAKAVAQIEAQVAAAEAKIAANAKPDVSGDSYLQVGEMIGDLALVYDWCAGTTTAAQRARWIAYANQAVWNVWNHDAATWGGKPFPWTGWATDDPSDNYYYSFLRATMLLGLATKGENPKADAWIDQFRNVKLGGQLVPEFAADLVGGGSREGTGYGVAMRNLWELYALWQWSTGEAIASLTPHARASLLTATSQIVPTLDRKLPIGDQSRDSTAALFDYERAYLLELAALYPTAPESASVVGLLAASSVPQMQNGFMQSYDFIYAPQIAPVVGGLPLVRYASGIGEINARSGWDKTATLVSLITGPYTQSHAHQDQGSLMIYKDTWLATDSVLWSKSGVTQPGFLVGSTAGHTMVRIDSAGVPIPQRNSPTAGKVLALRVGPGYMFAAVDVTAAYAHAAVTMVRRQVLWLQPDVVLVHDRVVTAPGTVQTWQLIAPTPASIAGAVATVVTGDRTLRVTRIAPNIGTWVVRSLAALEADLTGGFRLDGQQPGGDVTYITGLALDGAAIPPGGVVFAEVGCTFSLAGKRITLTAGIDPL